MHDESKLPPVNIVNMTVSVNIETKQIIFNDQSEIEDLALEILGTAENIYFDEIPIGNNLVIDYQEGKGWVLSPLNSDCI